MKINSLIFNNDNLSDNLSSILWHGAILFDVN